MVNLFDKVRESGMLISVCTIKLCSQNHEIQLSSNINEVNYAKLTYCLTDRY